MPLSGPLTPTALDLRWSHNVHARVDVLAHPTRLPDGNPAFVFRHGGTGETSDKRAPWISGGPLNLFAAYLQTQTAVPFDFVSIGSPQGGVLSPVSAAHLTNTWNEPRSRGVYWPESVAYMQVALQWLKSHAFGGEPVPELGTTLGIHPRDLILVGDGFGALLAFLSQAYTARQPRSSLGPLGPQPRFGPVAADSTVRGLVTLNLPADFRKNGAAERIHYSAFPGLFGTHTSAEWGAVEAGRRASASPLALIQSGALRFLPPVYLANELVGTHVQPYGDPATGAGATAADSDQWTALDAALTAASLAHAGETFTVGAWADEITGPDISARVYTWARGVLGR